MTAQLFTVRGVYKSYPLGEDHVQALQNVNFDLYPGERVVLLGASGSGKSTLLNIMGGLDRPDQGQVWYKNQDLAQASEKQLTAYRREDVGFVFQFYNLIPSLTALENVAVVTEIVSHPMLPEQALERVGLGHRKDHFPSQLSGGEQQRVAIARAIAKQPGLLLCDEPTGALDSVTGRIVLQALAEINRDMGATTVIITHNAVIGAMADRILYFRDGQIIDIKHNTHPCQPYELDW